MRKFIVLPLLVLLATCTDRGPIGPDGPDGPLFAKPDKCPDGPPCGKGGGDGDTEGEYTITDLGTLFDGKSSSSWARDLSEVDGLVWAVGASRSNTDAPSVATLWTVTAEDVETTKLSISGYSESEANGINSSGTIAVGRANSLWEPKPVWWEWNGGEAGEASWSGHILQRLGSLEHGHARGVNNGGQIVGWSWSGPGVFDYRATLWVPPSAEPQALHQKKEWLTSRAEDINEVGVAVGVIHIPDPGPPAAFVSHAVLWNTVEETACDLHMWEFPPQDWGPGDALRSHAHSVSESSNDGIVVVAGSKSLYGGESVAVVWQVDSSKCEIDAVELAHSADAYDVTVAGDVVEVVGIDRSSGNDKPVVWRFVGFGGSPVVVQMALPSLKGGNGTANAISGDHIVGRTKAGKGNHAVLWTNQ